MSFKNILILSVFCTSSLCTSLSAFSNVSEPAAPLYEASCKIKAKEAAAQIFRSCMSDEKNAQLEQIRKEFQDKLSEMRVDYEKELNRLSKQKKQNETQKSETPIESKLTVKTTSNPVKAKVPVKLTKKGLPLKSVKTLVSETLLSADSTPEMSLSLKPTNALVIDESQDIPEPIAIESIAVESTERNSSETATIQLD